MAATTERTSGTTRSLAAAALGCFALFVLVGVLVRIDWTPLVDLDTRIATDLHGPALDHPGEVRFWLDVSDVLSPTVLRIASVAVAAVLAARRKVSAALLLVLAAFGAWLLSVVGKLVVNRDRPHFAHPVAHAAGQSYPSGHALTSFAVFGAILLLTSGRLRRVLVAPCVLLVVAVGFSRLFLGVHYLSDVIGGWLVGTAELGLLVLVLRQRSPRAWARNRSAQES